MRLLFAISAALVLAVVLSSPAASSTSGKVQVTATITGVRTEANPRRQGAQSTIYLRLWNREITNGPIGHAFVSCLFMGSGGVFGSGIANCHAVYTMPLGKITASGLRHRIRRYTLVLTGGTGRYIGADGVAVSRSLGPGVLDLTILLR
jgi:hypothetical protein